MKKLILLIIVCFSLSTTAYALSTDLQNAKNDFDFQLDIYREAEKQFQIYKRDYEQNNTFANQELLVSAAREFLEQRAKTWDTYWQAVRIDILEQEDLPTDLSSSLSASIHTEQELLKKHQIDLKSISTRENLLSEALIFNDKSNIYKDLAYKSLAASQIGSIRTAEKEIKAFMNQVKKAGLVQIRDTSIRDERLRGIDETIKSLDQAGSKTSELIEKYFTQEKNFNDNTFEKINEELIIIFNQLTQAHQRASELSSDLEL